MYYNDMGLKEIMNHFSKAAGGRVWSVEEWCRWPYDIFGLTSYLLKMTGCYRYTVIKPFCNNWVKNDWTDEDLQQVRTAWRAWVFDNKAQPETPRLAACFADLKRLYDQNFPIRIIGSRYDVQEYADRKKADCVANKCTCRLWPVILKLHAYADHTCGGAGLSNHTIETNGSSIDYIANMLLTRRGTLSRLAKSTGIVLPKMRTTQVGLTYRSLSHHLTFHQTEVDVFWRSIPWVNREDCAINAILIPWPYEVPGENFDGHNLSSMQTLKKPYRYFHYEAKKSDTDTLTRLVLSLMKEGEAQANRVHMLIFPEAALGAPELEKLQKELVRHLSIDKIPIIVTGRHRRESQTTMPWNEVVLSVFFAGKWYDHPQSKHHRWKLDGWQIEKYDLAGFLPTRYIWWEGIRIPERRLSFFAPTSWLTACPLICEDLARLEPVSEIIRGVGPALLIALLLDGPQSKQRWSGHYATVLADDPGTSVLTITAAGMVKRSADYRQYGKLTIGLWKDALGNWTEIDLEKGSKGVLLTLESNWTEEYTADGISDHQSSAGIALKSLYQLPGVAPPDSPASRPDTPEFPYEVRDSLEVTQIMYTIDKILENPLGKSAVIDPQAFITNKDQEILRMEIERHGSGRVRKSLATLHDNLEAMFQEDIQIIYGTADKQNRQQSRVFVDTIHKFLPTTAASIDHILGLVSEDTKRLLSSNYPEVAIQTEAQLHMAVKGAYLRASRSFIERQTLYIVQKLTNYGILFEVARKIEAHLENLRNSSKGNKLHMASDYAKKWDAVVAAHPSTQPKQTYLRIEMLTIYCILWAMYKRVLENNNTPRSRYTKAIRYELKKILDSIWDNHRVEDYAEIMDLIKDVGENA